MARNIAINWEEGVPFQIGKETFIIEGPNSSNTSDQGLR